MTTTFTANNPRQDKIEAILAQCCAAAQKLSPTRIAAFRSRAQAEDPIVPGECLAADAPIELVLRESMNTSDMPLSYYLSTEDTEITKIGEWEDRPIFWLGSLGMFVLAEDARLTLELSLSWPAYPPGW